MAANVRFLLLRAIFLLAPALSCRAQLVQNLSRQQTDSLFQQVDVKSQTDTSGGRTALLALRAELLFRILDDPQLKQKYSGLDLHAEIARALLKLAASDKEQQFRGMVESGLAGITLDLANLGLEDLINSQKFSSPADAERAALRLGLCLSAYTETGNSQTLVDRSWKEDGLSWQWIRFYKAVANRKAGKGSLAAKEYGVLLNLGWGEPALYMEWASLMEENQKPEDALKLLLNGNIRNPEHIGLACRLARLQLARDQIKRAQATLRPYEPQMGFNTELVITRALIYEKKGDYKKADVLFKAVYQSDPNEVRINEEYAHYLIRKAVGAEKMDAEAFAQLAYNLLRRASDLSPFNENLKTMLTGVKNRYPMVTEVRN